VTGLSLVEELRAAAHAMDVEAARLDSLDRDASTGPWKADLPADEDDVSILAAVRGGWPICRSPDDGIRGGHDRPDAVMIVHRRNTLGRDAAVLRAMAAVLRDAVQDAFALSNVDEQDDAPDEVWAGFIDPLALAVARAFTATEGSQ
jgi:hypothetical protein